LLTNNPDAAESFQDGDIEIVFEDDGGGDEDEGERTETEAVETEQERRASEYSAISFTRRELPLTFGRNASTSATTSRRQERSSKDTSIA